MIVFLTYGITALGTQLTVGHARFSVDRFLPGPLLPSLDRNVDVSWLQLDRFAHLRVEAGQSIAQMVLDYGEWHCLIDLNAVRTPVGVAYYMARVGNLAMTNVSRSTTKIDAIRSTTKIDAIRETSFRQVQESLNRVNSLSSLIKRMTPARAVPPVSS